MLRDIEGAEKGEKTNPSGRVSPHNPAGERKNAKKLEEALPEIMDIVKKIQE